MSRIRWLLPAGLLLVAVLAGAWFLPGVLDWNRYRGEIASLASDTLGRNVRIDGPVALTLLPQPTLTAAGVTVDAAGGGITAKQLLLRVAFWPLLAGHVDARELVLRGADMRLPWPLQPDMLVLRAPAWLSSLSARIEDGRLSVGDVVLTQLDATLNTDDITGTTLTAGTAKMSGQSWRFTARLSRPGGDGSSTIDLTLDGQDRMQGIGATLSGQIAGDGRLLGRISGRGPDLSRLLPAPPVAFSADGRISIASGLAAADELTVSLAGSPARGAVSLRLAPTPRVDVALTASRLDLDAWLKALTGGPETGVLAGLPVGIDLSAEAAPYAGGLLRGLRGSFTLANGVVEMRELQASLPGDAGLRAAGRITVPDPRATPPRAGRFDGHVTMTMPTPQTTLGWLRNAGFALPLHLPDGEPRAADVAAHVVVDPGQIAIDSLTGHINGAAVSGSLTLGLAARPRIGLGLTVDRLDVDSLLPADLPGLPGLSALSALFAGFDANLRLEAKQAVLHGIPFAPLSLDAAAEAGRVTLREFDGVTAGIHVAASGTLGADGRVTEGQLAVQSAQASKLLALLPDRLAFLGQKAPALWQSPVNLQLLASGAANALALKLTADLADLRLEAQPTLDLPGGKWTATMTLRHPGAPRLADTLGIPNARRWLGDGSLSLVAQLSAAGDRITADSFDLTAGTTHASGTLALQRSDAGSNLTGQVTAESLALPLPAARSADPLPIAALTGWQAAVKLQAGQLLLDGWPPLQQATAVLTLTGGVLRMEGLTAKLGGGTLAGTLSIDTQAEPPAARLDANIHGATLTGPLLDLPFDLTGGTVDATASVTALGHSPAALLATLAGDFSLAARNGTLAGVDLTRATPELGDAEVNAMLAGGTMPFDRLDITAKIDGGTLQLSQAQLAAPSGSIQFTGSIDLSAALADLRLALRPAIADPPDIGLRVSGKLAAPRRTPELADLTRWRAARPAPAK